MPIWSFTMEYIDRREVLIDAKDEEEAREKMDSGDFHDEYTIDFYPHELIRDLQKQTD